eukprot:SAG31_NODE_2645_length_5313_cov_6.731300_6_plen_63_part_00
MALLCGLLPADATAAPTNSRPEFDADAQLQREKPPAVFGLNASHLLVVRTLITARRHEHLEG